MTAAESIRGCSSIGLSPHRCPWPRSDSSGRCALALWFVIGLGQMVHAQPTELVVQRGHTNAVTAVAIDPGGHYVASASLDDTVKVWETRTGREVRRLQHSTAVHAVAFNRDGHTIATGDEA